MVRALYWEDLRGLAANRRFRPELDCVADARGGGGAICAAGDARQARAAQVPLRFAPTDLRPIRMNHHGDGDDGGDGGDDDVDALTASYAARKTPNPLPKQLPRPMP